MRIQLFISLAFLGIILAARVEQLKVGDFKNIKLNGLEREVDLTDKYVKVQTKFTFVNDGITPVDRFYHIVPKTLENNLYHISLEEVGVKIHGSKIIDLQAESKYNVTVYVFVLTNSINERSKRAMVLNEHHFLRYEPLPKKIPLTDDQLVVYEDNVYFFTPYFVAEQQTRFQIRKIISYFPTEGATERGKFIEYQTMNDIQPFQTKNVRLHLENNKPLVTFKKVRKTIEVSHWGNIAILEEYSLYNHGANLTGEFGRVVFNKFNPNAGKSALKEMVAYLPLQTWGIHYRDEIGNISTSNAQRGIIKGEKQVKLQLMPRFPILGGWRSNFQISYNLPTSNNLQVAQSDADLHVLTQTFGFTVTDMVAEVYELIIILPEGASAIEHNLQSKTDSYSETLTFSYLDITGRPTLEFTKHLVSNLDAEPFTIQYKFKSSSIFREPLMILGAFLVFFMSLVAFGRLELVTLKLKKD